MMDDARIAEFCREAVEYAEKWRHMELGDGRDWPRRMDVASNATLAKVQAAMPGWTVRPAPPRSAFEAKHWPGVFLIWPPWAPPDGMH